MDPVFATAFFCLGALIASFVGVVVARLNTGEGILTGRSRCDACATPLSPFALVPILSFIGARGRAQCCGAVISRWSPLTELLLGGIFVQAYAAIGLSLALGGMLLALALLLALVLYDLMHQILPALLLIAFVVVSALEGFLLAPSPTMFFSTLLVALGIGGSLALVHYLSRGRAMGFADAPFAFGLALLAGPAAFAGFIFSFWIGAVIGIVVLLGRPAGSRMGVEVPFAPFLAAGFLLAYFTQWDPFIFATIILGQ